MYSFSSRGDYRIPKCVTCTHSATQILVCPRLEEQARRFQVAAQRCDVKGAYTELGTLANFIIAAAFLGI